MIRYDTSFSHDKYESPGSNLYRGALTAKLGLLRRFELDIGLPYGVGDQSSTNTGSLPLGFSTSLTSKDNISAFAIAGGYTPSFGSRYRFAQDHNRGDCSDGPSHFVAKPRSCYIRLLTGSTALAFDLVHGAKSDVGKNQTIIDVGFRHEQGNWRFSAGAGVGIGQQSPDFPLFRGFQRNFTLF